jgi:factor associated with neutral sphingomyelinase activation
MINDNSNLSRFSFYFLEEGEMYIKEFAGTCNLLYPESKKIEELKGNVHFGSRSIIFEPDSHEYSIIKFHFKYFQNRPKIQMVSNKEMFNFTVNRIICISPPPVYESYKIYDLTSEIYLYFEFEKLESVAEVIFELIDKYNYKQNNFEFDSIEYLGTLYSFQFDYGLLKKQNEKLLIKRELVVKQIIPLIEIPGMLMVTNERIYFQPVFHFYSKKIITIKISRINKCYKRKIAEGNKGLEICAFSKKREGKNIFLEFENEYDRNIIYELIINNANKDIETNFSLEHFTKLWVEGGISNYDYLMILNSAAERTKNNLSQYPIFPWIISNYYSEELDLLDINNYRDLSKPIGALNPLRLKSLLERYKEMPEPKFIYGTHYSNPSYVINYLVRVKPEYMLRLQSGKLDHPDRIYFSVLKDWDNCNIISFNELIPEFYEDNIEFLCNFKNIKFENNTKNENIENVILPKWALNPKDFLDKMRKALESDYVNNNLNLWIDLIFGYKQRGEEAIKSFNCKFCSFNFIIMYI